MLQNPCKPTKECICSHGKLTVSVTLECGPSKLLHITQDGLAGYKHTMVMLVCVFQGHGIIKSRYNFLVCMMIWVVFVKCPSARWTHMAGCFTSMVGNCVVVLYCTHALL